MRVILISGKAQAGKTTTMGFANNFLVETGKRVCQINYADLLKYICKDYFGWDGQKDEAGRQLLQHVGTEIVRAKDSNFWVDFMKRFARAFEDQWDYLIVGDCRFKNEVNWYETKFDTLHIRVVRPGYDNCLTEEQKKHPSETDLDDVQPDLFIVNDGTLDDLARKVKYVTHIIEQ